MRAIESENEELKDILPKTYNHLDNSTLVELLKTFNSVPMDIEPYHGRIFDPACGSGGMFVQSARFVGNHKKNPNSEISVYGQEKTAETVRLCKMNLAVHGLSGDIREGNSYYEDIHKSVGKFDFVMANSASDARGSEQDIRKSLIENGAVDVMVAVGSNFFYTVTLPCTLWFFDRGKAKTPRKDKVLFLDARQMLKEKFPDGKYVDVAGLCRVAALSDVEARELEGRIAENVEKLLEAG